MASWLRSVLVDLSGTIHIENTVIPGSLEAIKKLRESGLNLRFITNTTKESKRTLLNRLNNIGFDIQAHEVFTSLSAARQLIEGKQLRPMLLLQPDALQDFDDIDCSEPNCVVVGLAPDCFNYETLNKAFRLVLEGNPLIAIHKGRYYRRGDGMALGPGPFVAALEYCTDTQSQVIGKPEPAFFHQVLRDLGSDAESTIMIGDDARDDIGGSQAIGIKGILVKTGHLDLKSLFPDHPRKFRKGLSSFELPTKNLLDNPTKQGKYREGDESRLSKPPFAVCSDFTSAVNHILSLLPSSVSNHLKSFKPDEKGKDGKTT